MNSVFITLISLSISGSVLTLILLALRPFIRDRFSHNWQYYIWFVVILRFLLPIAPEINLISHTSSYIENSLVTTTQEQPINPINHLLAGNIETAAQFPPDETSGSLSAEPDWGTALKENIWLLWAVGMLVIFFYKIISYNTFVRFVKIHAEYVTDTEILDIYRAELAAAKIRRKIPLQLNERVGSPMLVGIIYPALIIPSTDFSAHTLQNIFLHELTHYRRGDIFYAIGKCKILATCFEQNGETVLF